MIFGKWGESLKIIWDKKKVAWPGTLREPIQLEEFLSFNLYLHLGLFEQQ